MSIVTRSVSETLSKPQRGDLRQPRATPWVPSPEMNRALKGRSNPRRSAAPSGLRKYRDSFPGAMPQAALGDPFGVKIATIILGIAAVSEAAVTIVTPDE